MATDNLDIPDIQSSQANKNVTANVAHNLLDLAMNTRLVLPVTVSDTFTSAQTKENAVIELTGTPGAAFTFDMFDTNERVLTIINNTDDVVTVRNSVAGGTGQPVIIVGATATFHYDGTDFETYYNSGNPVFQGNVDASSGGIYLGGTAAANLLDDYEEGIFTPVLADASSGGNEATAAATEGRYTKVGRLCTIRIRFIDINTSGLTAGNTISITGMPFLSSSASGVYSVGSVVFREMAFSGFVSPIIDSSDTWLTLLDTRTGAGAAPLIVSSITSGVADIYITLTYETT